MILLCSGIIIGLLLGLIFLIAGKKFTSEINKEVKEWYLPGKQAEIIRKQNLIEELLNDKS